MYFFFILKHSSRNGFQLSAFADAHKFCNISHDKRVEIGKVGISTVGHNLNHRVRISAVKPRDGWCIIRVGNKIEAVGHNEFII